MSNDALALYKEYIVNPYIKNLFEDTYKLTKKMGKHF
jgi:hypothetical protein